MAAGMPIISRIQLEWAGGASPGSPAGTGGKQRGAGGKKDAASDPNSPVNRKNSKNQKSFIRSNLGINFGVAALLKQSQIFTGVIGTIFQLFGALVDVILAPFLPIVVPAIKLIASKIPVVAAWARKLYEFLAPIFSFLGEKLKPLWDMASRFENAIFAAGAVTLIAWMKGFFTPLFKIVTAPIKLTVIILRRMSAAILKIVPAIVGLAGRILSPLGKIIYDNVATKIIDLGNKLYKPILNLLNPIKNLFSPLRNLSAKIGTYLSHHLGVLWGKIAGLLPDKIGISVAKYSKSFINAAKNAVVNVGKGALRFGGRALGMAGRSVAGSVNRTLPGTPFDDLAGFGGYAVKNPGKVARLAKGVPVLGTLITAALATHRTVEAAMEGDWVRAGLYAAHGATFTYAQLAADISSITGVGIGSSLLVAGADMGSLYAIDKALDKWSPTNQDKAQNAYQSEQGVVDIHPATNANGSGG